MTPVLVAAFAALGAIVPALVVLGSAPRRRLRLMREEAETLAAMPEGHPARDILSESLRRTANDYRQWWRSGPFRYFMYIAAYFWIVGGVGRASLVLISGPYSGETEREKALRVADEIYSQSIVFLIIGGSIMAGIFIWLTVKTFRIRKTRALRPQR